MKIERESLLTILKIVTGVADSCILTIKDNKLSAIVSAEDKTLTLFTSTKCVSDEDHTLNIGNVNILSTAIANCSSDELDITINNNNITYKDPDYSFKFHLLSDGILLPVKMNIQKVISFDYPTRFEVKPETIAKIAKNVQFGAATDKIYFGCKQKDPSVYCYLTDMVRDNTDEVSFRVSDEFTGDPIDPLAIRFENFKSCVLHCKGHNMIFSINKDYGICKINVSSDNVSLFYLASFLVV
jgi:hypothetical protein